jgi:uncharacterized integral membrane protein (TIGR00698 family)
METVPIPSRIRHLHGTPVLLPGLLLAGGITAVAVVSAGIQEQTIGHAVLDPLVLALILGLLIRATWTPPAAAGPGIAFAGKQLLEFAIVVLGLTLDLGRIVEAGGRIVVSVLLLVAMTLGLGTVIGRAMGLGTRLAVLVAVGNAICGNSAIAAVAPAIRAKKAEVAAAISLTAVFGVGVVLALPLLVPLLDLTHERYGVVAGLSVYAVPQVLAATFTVSAEAGQVASLVKLSRVVMLGPVVALLAFLFREQGEDGTATGGTLSLRTMLPWFVVGFALASALRTSGVVPEGMATAATETSRVLTAIAMAGLGLGVDIRAVGRTGSRVIAVVTVLTVLLVVSALAITAALGIG